MAAHRLVKNGPGTYAYDVNIARSKDNGKTWGKPVVPHTDRTQTEHGFVSLTPLQDGRLGAVWVGGRATKGVGEGDVPRVLVAFSNDAGATFGSPKRVDDGDGRRERLQVNGLASWGPVVS